MKEQLLTLLPKEMISLWDEFTSEIDRLYDVDKIWNRGFGVWMFIEQ